MIDYTKYSMLELHECLTGIDKEKFPENYARLLQEIELRKNQKPEVKAKIVGNRINYGYKIAPRADIELNNNTDNGGYIFKRLRLFNNAVEIAIDRDIKEDFEKHSMLEINVIRDLKWNHAVIFLFYSVFNLTLFFCSICGVIANSEDDQRVITIVWGCVIEILAFVFGWYQYYCLYSGLKYNIVRNKYSISYYSSNKYPSQSADFSNLIILLFILIFGGMVPIILFGKYINWMH